METIKLTKTQRNKLVRARAEQYNVTEGQVRAAMRNNVWDKFVVMLEQVRNPKPIIIDPNAPKKFNPFDAIHN